MEIISGQPVWLREGSQTMVTQYEYFIMGSHGWMCAWIDINGIAHQHAYITDSLTNENPNPK